MKKRISPAVIGAFVLGAIALAVAAIVTFGGGKFLLETQRYVLFFEGSVKGLSVGSPVSFRGVRVGSVSDIKLKVDHTDGTILIPVYVELEPDRITLLDTKKTRLSKQERLELMQQFVERGMRAQLQLQSLVTGQLMIQMDLHPDRPATLTGHDPGIPELPTIPSSMERISRTIETLPIEEILNRVNSIAQGLDELINAPEMKSGMGALTASLEQMQTILKNVDRDIAPLASRLETLLVNADRLVKNLDSQVQPLSGQLTATVNDTRTLVKNTDKRLETLSSDVTTTLATTRKQLEAALADIQRTVRNAEKQLTPLLATTRKGSEHTERILRPGSAFRQQFTDALNEFTTAAQSLRILVEYLEQHPESVLRGKQE